MSNTHYPISTVSNHIIPFVMSDHMHILSPPASNERVEFSSTATSTVSSLLAVGSNIPSIPQQTFFNAMVNFFKLNKKKIFYYILKF